MHAGLHRYEAERQYADARAVSQLSPYIHWGQLSVRLILHRLKAMAAESVSKTFWRRLYWRDLAYWQLYHWPAMANSPIRPHYSLQVCHPDIHRSVPIHRFAFSYEQHLGINTRHAPFVLLPVCHRKDLAEPWSLQEVVREVLSDCQRSF